MAYGGSTSTLWPWAASVLLFLGGIFFFLEGLGKYKLKKVIDYLPASKAIAVSPGITKIQGKAKPFEETLVSPYQKKKCIYYHTRLLKWKGNPPEIAKLVESKNPIVLEDETGSVLFQPTLRSESYTSQIFVERDFYEERSVNKELRYFSLTGENKTDTKLNKFIKEYAPEMSDYDGSLGLTETIIEEGQSIFAIGTARIYDQKEKIPRMIVVDDKNNTFCFSTLSGEETFLSTAGITVRRVFGGPILTAIGYYVALVLVLGTDSPLTILLLGLLAPLAMYSILIWIWSISVYNALYILKTQSERAKANIDALLVKRRQLVPNLVTVVKSYAKYEKGLQESITLLRAAQVGESEKTLFEVAEKYPNLKANENFMMLQKELVLLENQIAGSREYLNDAVMLYNRQIASFPYLLVAKIMNLRSIAYYSSVEE